jgi:hypothetical protein
MEFLGGLIALALLAGGIFVLVKTRKSSSSRLGIGRPRSNGDDSDKPEIPTE